MKYFHFNYTYQNEHKYIKNFYLTKLKKHINKFLELFDVTIIKKSSLGKINLEILKEPIIEEEYLNLIKKIENIFKKRFSAHSLYTVYKLCKYIHENEIEGDIIECGVYEGACVAMILIYFNEKNDFSRNIFLYDTFQGMTSPTNKDYYFLNKKKLNYGDNYCSLEDVKFNLLGINYDKNKIHFIEGDVINTLNRSRHQKISLLRLDTDFYESTIHELENLYDNVIKNCFIIYDDYGHWKGQYDAVNHFHKSKNLKPLLIRTSRKERIEIKF